MGRAIARETAPGVAAVELIHRRHLRARGACSLFRGASLGARARGCFSAGASISFQSNFSFEHSTFAMYDRGGHDYASVSDAAAAS